MGRVGTFDKKCVKPASILIASMIYLRYNAPMVVYVQGKKTPNESLEREPRQNSTDGWDDAEEKELEWLARGAGALARNSLQEIDKSKAEDCRRKLLEEMRTPG